MPAVKIVEDLEIGPISYQKKKGIKRISLRLDHNGRAKVSMPYHVPWILAEQFVKNHKSWILEQQNNHQTYKLINGVQIGKSHQLLLVKGNSLKTLVNDSIVKITYVHDENDTEVFIAAKKAIKRALVKEARDILPERLDQLAKMYDFE